MVRSLFIVSMAWMVILNSMVYSVICVNFQLNRSFISEMFCENKDIPMSTCEGHCFLDKQLDKATEKQASDWMDFRADFNLFILQEAQSTMCLIAVSFVAEHIAEVQDFSLQDYFFAQDKPPKQGAFL
ncbi:MAG: hypothetical protein JJU34_02635 [Lunatimonas sp.]|uniref:hypothetical protein n=1 Tax=Lunatimonas sp. TaxID=2060141 RepID=UPI00263B17B9|nr:hypothetical protein [Lunatimonas sp.]MCC5936157.1 hypothetical protein [Lunatimonas sp.]